MTDSHTHLTEDQIYNDLDSYIKRFIDSQGIGLLNVGHNPESNLLSIKLAKKYKNHPKLKYKSAIGLHPQLFCSDAHYPQKILSNESLSKHLRQYEELLDTNLQLIDAVGETGLDYYRLFDDNSLSIEQKEQCVELQKLSFRKHVELAVKHNLPLTIHIRESFGQSRAANDAIKIICELGKANIRGCFHSFTGEINQLETILRLGFYIGFNGIITYKSADNVRELLRVTPIDRILLETDAPYLPPQSIRSNNSLLIKHGQPSDISEIARAAALIKEIKVEKLIEESDRNFFALFGD